MQHFPLHRLRDLAIIAHVDHGKTSLTDTLLKQTASLKNEAERNTQLIMDQGDLEKERGMTILAKNTAIVWKDHKINIVDTPGHADFSGEVERILSMVDSVLLVVDAVEGPMPQTRYVTQKAFEYGLKPIVVVNKIDRKNARPDWVVDQVFELFDKLGANDEQLDFKVIYTSALLGFATDDHQAETDNMHMLLDTILEHIPAPNLDASGPTQIQISSLDHSSYLGLIGIGRVHRGQLKRQQSLVRVDATGQEHPVKISQIMSHLGLARHEVDAAETGDIVAIAGIDDLKISDTLCDPTCIEALPTLDLDPPTISIELWVNDSPFAGKEGKFLTSRQIWARLQKEITHNIALKVEPGKTSNAFRLSGRGELHLGVLLETMRREGFEMQVSRPQIIERTIDGQKHEPREEVVIEVANAFQGDLIATLGARGGVLQDMIMTTDDRVRMTFHATSRNLIGFHSEFMNICSGTGTLNRRFLDYVPKQSHQGHQRPSGVLISNVDGPSLAFAIWNLQARGKMFIQPQDQIYEGMIVGIHSRDNDLVVNPCKAKKLTNVRASGSDEAIVLVPAIPLTLEYAMTFINDDELVEMTPSSLRLRKKWLKEGDRKRHARQQAEGS